MGKYADLIAEQQAEERRLRARAAGIEAPEVAPDAMARALQVADARGLPPGVVATNLPEYEQTMTLDALDGAASASPALARWLGDPNHAALAKDDLPSLTAIAAANKEYQEKYTFAQRVGFRLNEGVAGAKNVLGALSYFSDLAEAEQREENAATAQFAALDSATAGQRAQAAAVATAQQAFAGELRQQGAREYARKAAPLQAEIAKLPKRPSVEAMQQASGFGDAWSMFRQDPLGAIGDIGVSSLVSQAPALAVTIATRNPAVSMAAMGANSGAVEFGGGVLDYLGSQGINTQDPKAIEAALNDSKMLDRALNYARTRAVIVGSFDAASGGVASRMLTPMRSALGREVANDLVAQPIVQASLGAGGEAMASYVTTGKVSAGDVLSEAVGEGFTAPVEAASLGVRARHLARLDAQADADLERSHVGQLVDLAAQSKTRGRSAARFESLIRDMTSEGEDTVYLSAEGARTLFQSADGADLSGLVDAEALREAIATGSEVAIPLAKYATVVTPEQHAAIAEQVRLQPGARHDLPSVSPEEIQEAIDAGLAEAAQQQERENGPAGQVYDDVYGQLLSRQDEAQARQNASVVQSVYRNLAERTGTDAWSLYQQFQLRIPGATTDRRAAPRGVDIDVDPLLDAIRTGKLPTDDEIYGASLSSALQRAGGLRESGGELANMDAAKQRPGLVNNLAGMSFDDAVGWAYEEGFITEAPTHLKPVEEAYDDNAPDQNTLLELLAQDLGGSPVYRATAMNAERAAFRDSAMALQEQLDQMGIDIRRMGNREVREALGLGDRTLEQSERPDTALAAALSMPGNPQAFKATTKAGEFTLVDREVERGDPRVQEVSEFGTVREASAFDAAGAWIGSLVYANDGTPPTIEVAEGARRQGVATSMLKLAREQGGMLGEAATGVSGTTRPGYRTDAGQAFREGADEASVTLEAIDARTLYQSAQTDTPEFRAWFGKSKVVDENGAPLVVYHGTDAEFDIFAKGENRMSMRAEAGFWFATQPDDAGRYGSRTVEAFLSIKKPKSITERQLDFEAQTRPMRETLAMWQRQGFDGLRIAAIKADPALDQKAQPEQWVAFRPEQIKSATANRGTFDPSNPSILMQDGPKAPRGSVTFGGTAGARVFNIELLAGMDASTFMHEMGHVYLEVLNDLAAREGAPAQIVDDSNTILQWLGVNPVAGKGPADSVTDRMQVGAKALSDFAVGKPLSPEAQALVGVQSVLDMLNGVAVSVRDPKVLRAVVGSLPVDVMDMLGSQQISPEDALQDSAVLQRVFSIDPDQGVSVSVDVAGSLAALVRSVARNAAVATSGDRVGGVLGDGNAAGGTVEGDFQGGVRTERRLNDALRRGWAQMSNAEQVEAHEKFARGWEAFLREGKAPSSALRRAFASFKVWLTALYRSVRSLNVDLTDDVRGVMDRIVASDAEIEEARGGQYQEALITDALAVGMSPEAFEAYNEAVQAARADAEATVAAEVLLAERREQQAWYNREKRAMRAEVLEQLRALPVYRAQRILRNGKLPDGTDAPDALRVKLSKDDLLDKFGQSFLRNLAGTYKVDGGVKADEAAALLGFGSGRELIDALVNAPKLGDAVAAETDARMKDRHPDPMTDGTLPDRAMMAAHRDRQADVMLREIRALEQHVNGRQVSQAAVIKGVAKGIIAAKKLRHLQAATYRSAEAKAGREAFEAAARQDWPEALAARRRQLLNFELFREAVRARDEAARAAKYLAKFGETKQRARLGKLGGDYLDQVDGLLDRFDFRKISDKAADRRASLADWIRRQNEAGIDVNLSPKLLDEAFSVPYRELTVSDLLSVRDAVRSIDHLARLKGKLLLAGQVRDAAEVDAAMADSLRAAHAERPITTGDRTPKDKLRQAFQQGRVIQATASDLARELDGFKDQGAIWMNTVGALRDAVNNRLNPALLKAQEDLATVYVKHYTKAEIRTFSDRVPMPEVAGDLWSKSRLLALALNWGNEGNREAILSQVRGRLSPEQVGRLLQRLDARDWAFVEDVWRLIDGQWPAIADAQKRRTGLVPERVQPSPFTVQTADGRTLQIPGGYYPLKYEADSVKSMKDEADDFYNSIRTGRTAKAATKNGHTIERVGSGGRTVRLDTGVIQQHLRDVLRDINLGDAVNYVHNVLNGQGFKEAVDATGVGEYRQALEVWLKDAASGEIGPRVWHERAMRSVRQNFTASVLTWKATTALLQVSGVIPSAVTLGYGNMTAGVQQYLNKPRAMNRYVREASPFMAARLQTHIEAVQVVMDAEAGRFQAGKSAAIRFGYWAIARVQGVVDTVTWLAAEQAGMAQFGGDVARARAYADDVVTRAQGSGEFIDKNPMQRGTLGDNVRQSEFIKATTMLLGYMIAKGNLAYAQTGKTNFKSPRQAAKWAMDMIMLFSIEGIITAAITGKLPKEDEDDDGLVDEMAEWILKDTMASFFGSLPGGSVFVSQARGYDTSGVVATAFKTIFDLKEQAAQGEMDRGVIKAAVNVTGILFGIPSSQINKAVDALAARADGRDVSPYEYLTGPSKE